MRELDPGNGTLLTNKTGDTLETGHMGIVPDAEVPGADAAARLHRRGLGHDESRASHGARAQVDEVPVRGVAVVA